MLCTECWNCHQNYEEYQESISSDIPFDNLDDFESQNDLQSDVIQDGKQFNPPTYADMLVEKMHQLRYGDTETDQQVQEKEYINVVIKNDKRSEHKCLKCKRRVINGIPCT